MPYKIAVASGKGGTGKTTVAVSLFVQIGRLLDAKIELVDCDVEEPNDTIFFPGAEKKEELPIAQLIPRINKEKCTYCRACVEYCGFNAIVAIPSIEFIEVNKNLCHSCGACLVACNHQAISEVPHPIGRVTSFQTKQGNNIKEGRLQIGSAMQTMLIRELKKQVQQNNDVVIYDAPPGTSCPVVETISDVHYMVLVTEPTPFGLHDLKLMVRLAEQLNLSYGVVVNKAGLGDDEVYTFLEKEKIELLGEIPFSKSFASLYANGDITGSVPIDIKQSYEGILSRLEEKITQYRVIKRKEKEHQPILKD